MRPDLAGQIVSAGKGHRLAIAVTLAFPLFAWSQASHRIFDGLSLKGWKVLGNGVWSVADSAIVGVHARQDPNFTQLVYDSTVTDFRVGFRFMHLKGNAGFFLRLEERTPAPPENVLGVQLVIEPTLKGDAAFGLYETNGRGWIKQWDYNANKALYKPGQWNSISIVCEGSNLTVALNGTEIVKVSDTAGRRRGKMGFKMHGGYDVEIRVKDVILEGPNTVAIREVRQRSRVQAGNLAGPDPGRTADGRRSVARGTGHRSYAH